jgi:hypothetical protein
VSEYDRKYMTAWMEGHRFFNSKEIPDGHKAWCATYLALQDYTENERLTIDYSGTVVEDELPRWPSNIVHLQRHCGGFYGLAVVLGAEKCGKTMLALGSCIEAAATGEWQVVYFGAELDNVEMAMRLTRYFEAHPSAVDAEEFLHVVSIGKGQTPEHLQQEIEQHTNPAGPPVLVCMDSINTLAEMSGRDYLKTLRDYALWAMLSRRISNGAVSFLIVSETNHQGGAKGGKLEFWADQVLKMGRTKTQASTGIVPVKMNLMASRRTGGEGDMGIYLRNQKTCRFCTEEELERPQFERAGGRDWLND